MRVNRSIAEVTLYNSSLGIRELLKTIGGEGGGTVDHSVVLTKI
jgi:hypothetical protein